MQAYELDNELREAFLEEATQLLSDAEQCFLALEASPNDKGLIDKIFRLAHNLKGSSGIVGFNSLAEFTHELESLLMALKFDTVEVNAYTSDLLLKANDVLRAWIDALKLDPNQDFDCTEVLSKIKEVNNQALNNDARAPVQTESVPQDVEVDLKPSMHVDHVTQSATLAVDGDQATHQNPAKRATDESIRVSLSRVDSLVDDIGELVILQSVLKQQKHLIESQLVQSTIDRLTKITRSIQDNSMRLRMVPLQSTFQKMQRVLRDTSRSLGKDVQLHLSGEETELDKTVVERIGDPLVHLIRNGVDHGIESQESRQEAGKSSNGNIWLRAYHQSSKIVIEVRDDGKGLDPDKLKQSAIKKGLIQPDAALDNQEALQLIFAPGFSTKTEVTGVSGRGVGMDVVKTNIESLSGQIEIETEIGKGTCFRLFLPLTLAIIEGMIVQLTNDERYIVPLSQVSELVELTNDKINKIGKSGEAIELRGEAVPIYRLSQLLDRTKSASKERSRFVAVVSQMGSRKSAFLVDAVLSRQQIVLKQLGKDLRKIQGVSGSAILGDGRAALVLDLNEMISGKAA